MEVTAKETQRRGPTEELRTGLQEVPRLTAGRGQGGGARNEGRDSWIVGALAPRRPDLRPRQNGQSKSWKRQRQTENSSETSAGHPPAEWGAAGLEDAPQEDLGAAEGDSWGAAIRTAAGGPKGSHGLAHTPAGTETARAQEPRCCGRGTPLLLPPNPEGNRDAPKVAGPPGQPRRHPEIPSV